MGEREGFTQIQIKVTPHSTLSDDDVSWVQQSTFVDIFVAVDSMKIFGGSDCLDPEAIFMRMDLDLGA